jgi:hypothetical protein
VRERVARTLPSSIRHNGHARFYEPVQRDEAGLDCPAHGAHDDELHRAVRGEVGFEMLAELGGLLAAEVCERRVREDVVGSCTIVSSKSARMVEWALHLLSTLWIACAWRMRTRVGGILESVNCESSRAVSVIFGCVLETRHAFNSNIISRTDGQQHRGPWGVSAF